MKNIFFTITLFGIISLGLFSCKDQLNLMGEYQETAIVVGVLDQGESTHYVKVMRSFIGDGNTSSLDLAQIPDSNYFQNVEIQIQEVLENGASGRLFELHDTLVENKNTNGIFFAPQQKVYVFYTPDNAPLLETATYKMTISIDGGRIVVTGETGLVKGMAGTNLSSSNSSAKFISNNNGEYANQTFTLSAVGNAKKLNASYRFDYRDYEPGLADSADYSVIADLGDVDVPVGQSSYSYIISGEQFYRNLKAGIDEPVNVEKRIYTGIEFKFIGANEELSTYMDVSQPSNSLAQNKPVYTNLKVTEGFKVIGIFGARYSLKVYKPATGVYPQIQGMDKKSRKELCTGPITGLLGFCSNHVSDYAPNLEPWACD